MSSDSSPQSPPQATASVRDSAGYEWEELATPADGGENLLPPPKPVHVSQTCCCYVTVAGLGDCCTHTYIYTHMGIAGGEQAALWLLAQAESERTAEGLEDKMVCKHVS